MYYQHSVMNIISIETGMRFYDLENKSTLTEIGNNKSVR